VKSGKGNSKQSEKHVQGKLRKELRRNDDDTYFQAVKRQV